MDATRQQRVLDQHNRTRARYGVAPLQWDAALAGDAQRYAQRLAQSCVLQHASRAERPGQGENLASGYPNADRGVDGWFDEEQYFNCNAPFRSGPEGHFTQAIWDKTTRLGCGAAPCASGRGEIVVCRYTPAGNYLGEYTVPPENCRNVVPPGEAPVAPQPTQPTQRRRDVPRTPAPEPAAPRPRPRMRYAVPPGVPRDALHVTEPSPSHVRTYFWPARQDELDALDERVRAQVAARVQRVPEWRAVEVQPTAAPNATAPPQRVTPPQPTAAPPQPTPASPQRELTPFEQFLARFQFM